MSIFQKLLLSFLALVLLLWIVAFSAISIIHKTLTHSAEQEALFSAKLLMRGVDEDIQDELSRMRIRMQDPNLLALLRDSNETFDKTPDVRATIDQTDQAWGAAPQDAPIPIMNEILNQPFSEELRHKSRSAEELYGYPVFDEIFVTNRYGANVAMTGRTTDYRQDDESWWKEAWEKGKSVEEVESHASTKTYAVPLAVRIEDKQGVPLGVAKGVLNIRQVLDFLDENRERQHFKKTRVLLLDSRQRIIYPLPQFGKEVPSSWRDCAGGNPDKVQECVGVIKGMGGAPKFVAHVASRGYADYPGLGWSLVLENDVREVLAPLKAIEVFLLGIAAFATFLALLLGTVFSRKFSESLGKLDFAAGRYAEGDFAAKVDIVSKDEFGKVARGFEVMAQRLRNSTTSIWELQQEIERGERLQKVLRENEEKLRVITSAVQAAILMTDVSGKIIFWNDAANRMFGYDVSKTLGVPMLSLIVPESAREIYERDTLERLKSGEIGSEEKVLERVAMRKDGSEFPVEVSLAPVTLYKENCLVWIIRDITERKRAEENLARLNLKHKIILQSAAEGILGLDLEGNHTIVNDAAAKMLGYKAEEILGQPSHSLWHHTRPDGSPYPREKCQIYASFREGMMHHVSDEVFWRKDGTCFPVEYTSMPLYEQGKVVGAVVTFVDITERKRAEAMLLESEKRFLDVLYASPDAILLIDGDKFVDCNEATARMLGYATREEFLMTHPSELSPPKQPDGRNSFDKANEMMKGAFAEGFNRFEWTHKKASGENFPVEVSLTPISMHGKNVLHCLWRDLTEIKKAETKIRQLSQAVEQSPSCVVITDKDAKIEYVNKKFTELTGYTLNEVLGQNPRVLKSGETPPEYYKDLWNTILSGQEWRGQFVNKKKNGELYWEFATIAPIRDAHGNIAHFMALKEDITYRRQIEEKLRHSLRMEAVGRLAGGIAHDFNNMLTVINGYSGYMMGKMKPEDPHYDKICLIREAGDCAATIVRQLLNLSRKEAPKPQLIRIDEAIKKIEHMIGRILGDDIQFLETHAPDADFVKMDPGQMEQVLLNLLVNAREAMPAGGTLTVTTDLVRMEEIHEELKPSQKRKGEFIRIMVQDTGAGIDPSLRARIFEPFFTTKKRGMNTGLGLSIVCGIIEEAGGSISFESQLGRGTTFRLYLPRAKGENDSKGRVFLEDLPPGHGKILLVEDESPVREFALQVLRERGYDVRVAHGGEEALAMLADDPGKKIDLLLTDLTMPKMNGKDLVIQVRKQFPDLKVIFMSGYSEQAVAEMKDTCFLQKPFSHRALAMKVWEVLGR